MNLLGAIGTLINGSGISRMFYEQFMVKMQFSNMTGKAVQRALRGHLLLDQCIVQQVVSKAISDKPGIANLLHELEEILSSKEH